MTLIRTTRFTADPAEVGALLERRRKLLDAVRTAFAVARDVSAEQGDVVDEDVWAR